MLMGTSLLQDQAIGQSGCGTFKHCGVLTATILPLVTRQCRSTRCGPFPQSTRQCSLWRSRGATYCLPQDPFCHNSSNHSSTDIPSTFLQHHCVGTSTSNNKKPLSSCRHSIVDERTNGQMDKWTNGQMDLDEWMDE